MASIPRLVTQQYRIRTDDVNDGATCFLTNAQALGFGLHDTVHAYAPGRETVHVQVSFSTILGFELV